ncbi:hypothetical protein NLI96_g4054 [Meripilus lineatus]|uniref:NADH:flavin oxidoreductase/NADH oxidase N-terminal domain-containing protein n=1 Tax=Meripilus lineatus TaxID=2056292 RepID=A0AAD5YF47_9APHY|nr:hypothetical protein NLI96_g4054 [Physisporinus lineatus]
MASLSKLFTPIKVGDLALKHRVVLAPLTRYRNTLEHVPTDLSVEYYSQRASTPGTLLITEATAVAARAGGYENIPHLETAEQIAGWKKVTDAVHAKGSYIFAQLWALGRTADPKVIKKYGYDYAGASDIPLENFPVPRPLGTGEVKEFVQLYANAAANAIQAGFDGVEIHGANGYLPDQFLQDVSNNRADEYGGSIENRARFPLEIIDAIVNAVGTAKKVAIRLSPWETFQGMRMKDPIPTFSYLVSEIAKRHPDFAYVHVIEARFSGGTEREVPEGEGNEFLQNIWAPRPFINAGGYTRELALKAAETEGNLVAFGRHFIANPDLPLRLRENVALNKYDRNTFFKALSPEGYIDYPFDEGLQKAIHESDKAAAPQTSL